MYVYITKTVKVMATIYKKLSVKLNKRLKRKKKKKVKKI